MDPSWDKGKKKIRFFLMSFDFRFFNWKNKNNKHLFSWARGFQKKAA